MPPIVWRCLRVGGSAAALLAAAPLAAQGVFNMGQLTATLSTSGVAHPSGGGGRMVRPAPNYRPRPVALAPAAVLLYRPDPARRQRNMGMFVARTRTIDPQGAAKMARVFARQDPIAAAQAWMRPYGLSVANLADAAATYLAIAWYAAHGSTRDPSRPQLISLRDQLARAMRADPAIARAGDAAKQQTAEITLISAIIAGQGVQEAGSDPARVRQAAAAVVQGARASFGLDLMRMRLTDRGLVLG